VEAVRWWLPGLAGWLLAREAWERYHLPLAITEVQLAADDQDRALWLWRAWQAAVELRAEGVDLRAICAWAAFGAFGWDSLATHQGGRYEPGIYTLARPDGRRGAPRPTLVTQLVRTLAAGRESDLPGLGAPGWWERPNRLLCCAEHARPSAHASA
jgi:dTDP-4-dehydrorhamnose reductase